MTPLDLTAAPPRPPHEMLDGLLFLPRTIDKARALLPGGKSGDYKLGGFSATMLEMLGVAEDDFVRAVGDAQDDAEVATWLRAHAKTDQYEPYNEWLRARALTDENKERFAARYPVSRDMPVGTKLLDMLVADDAAAFAKPGQR